MQDALTRRPVRARRRSAWWRDWAVRRRLMRRWQVVIGSCFVLGFVTAAIAGPLVAPHDPYRVDLARALAPPSPQFLLGTDTLGRDIVSRLAWGARVAFVVSTVPVIVALGIGLAAGVVAGYAGGLLDYGIMRILDVWLAFPTILLALGLAAALGPGLRTALIAMMVVNAPPLIRLVRGLVLAAKEHAYVEAARSLGASTPRVLVRHMLVNIVSPVIVYTTLQTGRNVILAASLSFLGLGIQPPAADWGVMLSEGRSVIALAPAVATIPGLAIFLVTLGFNLVGDGMRDILDPLMRS